MKNIIFWIMCTILLIAVVVGSLIVFRDNFYDNVPTNNTNTITNTNTIKNNNIKIGAILSITGEASEDGQAIKNGIDLAVKDLKVEGYNVDINYQNDGTDPKITINGINILKDWGAQAIIGPTWSFLGDVAAQYFENNKIVSFQPANTSEFTEHNNYTFFGSPRIQNSEGVIRDFLSKNNIKTIVILSNKGPWYNKHNQIIEKLVDELNIKVIYQASIEFNDLKSIDGILYKIKNKNIDLFLVNIDDGTQLKIFFNVFNLYDFKSKILTSTTAVNKVISDNDQLNTNLKAPIYFLTQEHVDGFVDKYHMEYKSAPGVNSEAAFDGVKMLTYALSKKSTTQDVSDYLKNNPYQGYLGIYKFDDNNDISINNWIIKQLK